VLVGWIGKAEGGCCTGKEWLWLTEVRLTLPGNGNRPKVEYQKVDITPEVEPDEAMEALVEGFVGGASLNSLYTVCHLLTPFWTHRHVRMHITHTSSLFSLEVFV
jgi:hypothetical protein